MKNVLLCAALLIVAICSAQQPPATYHTLVREADSLLTLKQYLPAAEKYSAAFKSFGWRGYVPQRYDAARSWAMAGIPDSAFFNLERIASKGNFDDYRTLQADTAFVTLYADARWPELLRLVKKNGGLDETTFIAPLFKRIDSLAGEDQKWRLWRRDLQNGSKVDSLQVAEAIARIDRTDSLNYPVLAGIVAEHGFPGYDKLGKDGVHKFWLLVQHQDRHPDFQERVLALMEVAVQQNQASGHDYAYLLDRVMVNTGRLQVYGTQMQVNQAGTSFEPKPCVDPGRLDERRASVGLGTIAGYIEVMNRTYSGEVRREK